MLACSRRHHIPSRARFVGDGTPLTSRECDAAQGMRAAV